MWAQASELHHAGNGSLRRSQGGCWARQDHQEPSPPLHRPSLANVCLCRGRAVSRYCSKKHSDAGLSLLIGECLLKTAFRYHTTASTPGLKFLQSLQGFSKEIYIYSVMKQFPWLFKFKPNLNQIWTIQNNHIKIYFKTTWTKIQRKNQHSPF